MELEHTFSIPVPVEKAWPVLLDVEQIAPCMPGASVDSVDGDDFTGSVKVKLGPINLTYKGQASFVEKDEAAHRAVIDARGRDSRGNGTAAAKVTATLTGAGDTTEVKVVTDLNITGKPAQFGRGVMVDVGNKLIGQFADCLAGKLSGNSTEAAADKGAAAVGGASASGSGASTAAGDEDKTPTGSVPVLTPEDPGSAALDSQPGSKSDSGSVPAGSQSPAPTPTPPAPARPKPAEPEPIDLIELAGGSVAKKAAPVVIALLIGLLVAVVLGKKRKK
jgi:uncharacterized protein